MRDRRGDAHFERWEVRTGRRVADYTPAESGRVTAPSSKPEWVRMLNR